MGRNILQVGLIVVGYFLGLFPAYLFLKAGLFMAGLFGFSGNFFGGLFGDSANVFMIEFFRNSFAMGLSLTVVNVLSKLKSLKLIFVAIFLLVILNVIASYMLILDVGSSDGKIVPLVGAIVGLVFGGLSSILIVVSNISAVNEELKSG